MFKLKAAFSARFQGGGGGSNQPKRKKSYNRKGGGGGGGNQQQQGRTPSPAGPWICINLWGQQQGQAGSSTSGGGPMKVMPASAQAWASSGFSLRNP